MYWEELWISMREPLAIFTLLAFMQSTVAALAVIPTMTMLHLPCSAIISAMVMPSLR